MTWVFDPPALPYLPVQGSDARFPLRRIFCVGRNYAEHARELGNDPDREPPFFFTKPADSVVLSGATIPYPTATANLHHEAELVVALAGGGSDVAPEAASALIFGYAAGNDLTRRDLQAAAKEMRRPWDMAKGFDRSAVCGPLRRGPLADGAIRGLVNGALRQQARLSDMIWPVADVIAHLSRLVRLAPGDLIFTGTPAGVGPLQPGDVCRVEIDGLSPAEITIAAATR
ncbi:MAG: fumarylacetoacetate hydrolase family protein [Rhodobacteraceae bacterium]|jgi:fumarylpyruvate hydrolase|nr:fumarylacetoacetate hydrolase family protein [Paracoccaceae bacterium]